MADILDMQQQRRRLAASRGFATWSRRFSTSFDDWTTLADLDDNLLRVLIQGNHASSLLLHQLIMGVLKLGKRTCFDDLESPVKLVVMDIGLFLLDQLRFEVMRRLGWVEPTPFASTPAVDLIENFTARYAPMRTQTPQLLRQHPRYREYQEVFEPDRAVFVRRLIPEAIEQFEEEPEGA